MKAMTVIAAALLAAGAAHAQQGEANAPQTQATMHAQQQDQATTGEKLRHEAHKLGEETAHAFHRAGDAVRRVVHREHPGDARTTGADLDRAAAARRQRMDAAYADWQAKRSRQVSHG